MRGIKAGEVVHAAFVTPQTWWRPGPLTELKVTTRVAELVMAGLAAKGAPDPVTHACAVALTVDGAAWLDRHGGVL
jgi:hypothetical protein